MEKPWLNVSADRQGRPAAKKNDTGQKVTPSSVRNKEGEILWLV